MASDLTRIVAAVVDHLRRIPEVIRSSQSAPATPAAESTLPDGLPRSTGWQRFRRSRLFVPAAVLAPVVALGGTGAAYGAWDATRVDVPNVVGAPLGDGVGILEEAGLTVSETVLPDPDLHPNCFVIAEQSVPAGDRVVAKDTAVGLAITPATRGVPDVVGMTFAEAKEALRSSCFTGEASRVWCSPEEFSGGPEALESEALAEETGFRFDATLSRLRHDTLVARDSWVVCDQDLAPPTSAQSMATVGLALGVPLTTVPQPTETKLGAVLEALTTTPDGCTLRPELVMTSTAHPEAIAGARAPATEVMAGWTVAALTPAPGHAVLCDEHVAVQVVWPMTKMPKLVGRFHAPGEPGATTPATEALRKARIEPSCSGFGTVTSQSPEPGTIVPVATAVTCSAELIMPKITGLKVSAARKRLAAAGITEVDVTGSGTVVRQFPKAGERVDDLDEVEFTARRPKPKSNPVTLSSGGGGSAYYKNCTEARKAGVTPIYRGQPGYRPALDRDNDGIACE